MASRHARTDAPRAAAASTCPSSSATVAARCAAPPALFAAARRRPRPRRAGARTRNSSHSSAFRERRSRQSRSCSRAASAAAIARAAEQCARGACGRARTQTHAHDTHAGAEQRGRARAPRTSGGLRLSHARVCRAQRVFVPRHEQPAARTRRDAAHKTVTRSAARRCPPPPPALLAGGDAGREGGGEARGGLPRRLHRLRVSTRVIARHCTRTARVSAAAACSRCRAARAEDCRTRCAEQRCVVRRGRGALVQREHSGGRVARCAPLAVSPAAAGGAARTLYDAQLPNISHDGTRPEPPIEPADACGGGNASREHTRVRPRAAPPPPPSALPRRTREREPCPRRPRDEPPNGNSRWVLLRRRRRSGSTVRACTASEARGVRTFTSRRGVRRAPRPRGQTRGHGQRRHIRRRNRPLRNWRAHADGVTRRRQRHVWVSGGGAPPIAGPLLWRCTRQTSGACGDQAQPAPRARGDRASAIGKRARPHTTRRRPRAPARACIAFISSRSRIPSPPTSNILNASTTARVAHGGSVPATVGDGTRQPSPPRHRACTPARCGIRARARTL